MLIKKLELIKTLTLIFTKVYKKIYTKEKNALTYTVHKNAFLNDQIDLLIYISLVFFIVFFHCL